MDKKQIRECSLRELKKAIEERSLSCEEITEAYLSQIKEVDGEIGAYLHVNQKARQQAKALDERLARGESLGALGGIPVGVKDNLCTVDMPTTCASKMMEGYMSPFDAEVVKRLRSADAIILGKMNMDEFAMGGSTENSYFKKTKNPHDQTRVPGGSSGGSAAAVAGKEALLTLGSDTGGSIRQPSGFCGTVGIKPTYGSISRNGLIAFASSLDQIGPIGRRVEDVAQALDVLVGHDPKDSTSIAFDKPDYGKEIYREARGMKVALPKSFFEEGIQTEVKEGIYRAAENMERMGVRVEEVHIENLDYALPAYYIISSAEASSNLARFDSVQYGYRTADYENLEELYKKTREEGFGKEVKRRILLGTYALSSGYYEAYYKKAQKVRTLIKNAYDEIFKDYDLILTPVTPTTAYPLGSKREDPVEAYLGDIYTVPVNIAGLPGMSMNCGFDKEGLPIGMQFIGGAFQEDKMLRLAYHYEQTFGIKQE